MTRRETERDRESKTEREGGDTDRQRQTTDRQRETEKLRQTETERGAIQTDRQRH